MPSFHMLSHNHQMAHHFPHFYPNGYPEGIVGGISFSEGKQAGLWYPRRASADRSIFSRPYRPGLAPPCGGEPSSSSPFLFMQQEGPCASFPKKKYKKFHLLVDRRKGIISRIFSTKCPFCVNSTSMTVNSLGFLIDSHP